MSTDFRLLSAIVGSSEVEVVIVFTCLGACTTYDGSSKSMVLWSMH